MAGRAIDSIRTQGDAFRQGTFVGNAVLGRELLVSATTVNTTLTDSNDADKYPLEGAVGAELVLMSDGENYSAGDSLTVKLWVRENDTFFQLSSESVTVPSVDGSGSATADHVLVSSADFDRATHISVSGTLTVGAGELSLALLKKALS